MYKYIYDGDNIRKEETMMRRKQFRTLRVLGFAIALVMVFSVFAFAADASIKKINYKGAGKVQVVFSDTVSYGDVKVSVKDNSGDTYTATVKSKNSTSMQFIIKNCAVGKTYKFTISGVNKGKVSGNFSIITKKKATTTAKNTAKKKWKAESFTNVTTKSSSYKDTAVWKVSFKSGNFNYTYMVTQQKGKVIYYERKQAD